MKIPKKIEPIVVDEEAVIASAAAAAQTLVAAGKEAITASLESMDVGAAFVIDILVPEEVETGDGRQFDAGAVDARDFPLPLFWQIAKANGHDGAVLVARIDSAERIESGGWGNARGVFDTGVYGREAERLVRGGFLRGVSVDLDKFEAKVAQEPQAELATEDGEVGDTIYKNEKITVASARIVGATLTPTPAFQECTIRLAESEEEMLELPIEDGEYEEVSDDPDAVVAALIASAAPVVPPREWLSNPGLNKLTPITVTDDGHVFGHIASWTTDHIGLPRATKPPRSRSNYAYFRTGVLRTDTGEDVPVGQLTLAGGHADVRLSSAAAVKHYDDTASAVADVSAGEDRFGIWVSGSIRPDATPAQIRALRASAPSGDWRPINGKLELVAVCQVNVPGFPVARAMVAGGQVMALVAAGARPIAELRENGSSDIEERLSAIEQGAYEAERRSAFAKIAPIKTRRDTALTAAAISAQDQVAALKADHKARLQVIADAAKKSVHGE